MANGQLPVAQITTTTTVPTQPSPLISLTDKDDTNGAFKGQPRWARLVNTLGLPVVLVFWLLWNLLGSNAKTVDAMSRNIASQAIQMEQHNQNFQEFIRLHTEDEGQVKAILMQICANSAKTNAERSLCFPTK